MFSPFARASPNVVPDSKPAAQPKPASAAPDPAPPRNTTTPASAKAASRPKATIKKTDIDSLNEKMASAKLFDKYQTTTTYLPGVEGLLVVPLILWSYRKNLQQYCKAQLHLPSAWTETELQSYEIEKTSRGENTRLLLEFVQLRGFHSVQRLTNCAENDQEKTVVMEGPLFQGMKHVVQNTLEHAGTAVKVGGNKRLMFKIVIDLPFPVEKNFRPSIMSFVHDLQPDKSDAFYWDADGNEVDPFEDEWPTLDIFDVNFEAIEKPTNLKSKSVRRTRVRGKLFDDVDSP